MNIQETLTDRNKTHGNFDRNATCAQLLKGAITLQLLEQDKHLSPVHREALDMICNKIGRIIAGDPNFEDHWHDIAGYAELARKACSSTPKSSPHTAESTLQSDRSSGAYIQQQADRHNDSVPPSPSGRPL